MNGSECPNEEYSYIEVAAADEESNGRLCLFGLFILISKPLFWCNSQSTYVMLMWIRIKKTVQVSLIYYMKAFDVLIEDMLSV